MSQTSECTETFVGYVPVINRAYMDMFHTMPEAALHILGADVLEQFPYVRKDLRALEPNQVVDLLVSSGRRAEVLGTVALNNVLHSPGLVMPDDDISRSLADEYGATPRYYPAFLRWNRDNVKSDVTVTPDRILQLDSNEPIIKQLFEASNKSTSWWRAVAAATVTEHTIVALSYNVSRPTEYTSSIDGDPSITRQRGENIDIVTDIHAEAQLVAQAARDGRRLDGTSLYVTTFPCGTCAKLVVEAGITSCYFVEGYANLDGETTLRSNGIEIVKIDTTPPETDPTRYRPYPT